MHFLAGTRAVALGAHNCDHPAMELPPNPLAPLRRLIDHSLTVADIVASPLWTVDPRMSALDAHDILGARAFDIAGVSAESVSSYVSDE